MAVNLRLSTDAARALSEMARRTGRSQQQLLRLAVDRLLGIGDAPERGHYIAAGLVRAPTPYRDEEPRVTLADGATSMQLLDRDDR